MLHKVAFSPHERKHAKPVLGGRDMLRGAELSPEQHEKHHALDSSFLAERGCLSQPRSHKPSPASHAA